MDGSGIEDIKRRIAFCDYLSVAQIFLRDNFLLERPLNFSDIKPRLLGHWGACPGINFMYANIHAVYPKAQFILGSGHGFPALQANLFYDGDLLNVDEKATRDKSGIEYICKSFSWPYGFPSHASPYTPNVITEGGELGYALGAAYGAALNKPGKLIFCLMGDGELETATAIDSLNLNKLLATPSNGKVIPVLNLNGYKISGPTIFGRKSERELMETIRGFGFIPCIIKGMNIEKCQSILKSLPKNAFLILISEKGYGAPKWLGDKKIVGNFRAHQVPLPEAGTNPEQLKLLEDWLRSYNFKELYEKF